MIAKSSILQNIKNLDALYSKATSQKKSLFYAKLAILELSGWIEESMDDIVLRFATKHLKEIPNQDFVRKEVVGRTNSFTYERHFRPRLVKLVGIVRIERLESKIDQVKFQQLKQSLTALKYARDTEAHTHLKGTTRRLDAPSVTKQHFFSVYEGLLELEGGLKRL